MPTLGRFLAAGTRQHADPSAANRMVHGALGSGYGGTGNGGDSDFHGYRREPSDSAPCDVARVHALLQQRQVSRQARS